MTLASTYVLRPGLQSWGGCVFWSNGSCQDRDPKQVSWGVGEGEMQLGLIDVNLQTEEIYCNYSVLIGSAE